MIGRRLVLRIAAAAAIATAAVLAVIAAAWALYALFSEAMTPAAASALTALVLALAAALGGFLLFGRTGERDAEPPSLAERIGVLARERPLMAGAAALAAGWIFMRNPALATVVAAALSEKGRHRRR